MINKTSRVAFVAIALSAIVATPATAAPVAYDGNNFTYGNVENSSFGSNSFEIGDTSPTSAWETANPTSDTYNNNWDGHGAMGVYDTESSSYVYYDGTVLTENCTQDTTGDDYIFSCDEEELLPGLFVHPEYRAFDALSAERLVWVFRNDSNSEITFDASHEYGSECDGDGYAEMSNGWTGEEAVESTDFASSNWMVEREEDLTSDECGIEAAVWQSEDAGVQAESVTDPTLNDLSNIFTLTIPAGKTQALAFFYSSGWIDDDNLGYTDLTDPTDPYVAGRQAAFTDQIDLVNENFTSLTDANTVGLDADLNIVNWEPVDEEDLANTGVDASGIALGAVALLAVGGAIAIRRRARA